MLLRHLLTALASGQRGRKPVSKDQRPAIPGTRFTNNGYLSIDGGTFQSVIANLTADQAWEAFCFLPPVQQLALIEGELAALPANQSVKIHKLLAGHLQRPWLPLPGPQTEALCSDADVLFYGGGAGSGKSALLCGTAICDHYRVRLFRRESVQVRGLVDEAHKIVGSRDGYNGQEHVWRLSNDRQIEFAHCQYEQDKEKYQGRAADLIGFDELTHFSESQFRYLIGWNRSDKPGQRSRVIATGNPPERSDGRWVLAYWAAWLDPSHPNPAQPGELRWYTTVAGEDIEVDGRGPHLINGEKVEGRSRTFIRGVLSDNPYLAETGYAATLQAHPEPLRSMLLEGRFDLAVNDDPWQVIPSAWIDLAQRRWTDRPPEGQGMSCLGVDVAQGGEDETVLAARHGTWFAPLKAYRGIDTKDGAAVAGLIFATMRDACEVAIDVGGGWGADAYGHIRAQQIKASPVNWVETSNEETRHGHLKFLNKRAEAWWRLREALDPVSGEKIALPPDKTLSADLATPLWHRTPSGLIKIEDKADIRKRLGRSPDRGDALVMAWANGWLLELERARNAPLPSRAVVSHADLKRHGQGSGYGGRLPAARPTSKDRTLWR